MPIGMRESFLTPKVVRRVWLSVLLTDFTVVRHSVTWKGSRKQTHITRRTDRRTEPRRQGWVTTVSPDCPACRRRSRNAFFFDEKFILVRHLSSSVG